MKQFVALAAPVLILAAHPALADDPDEGFCRNGAFVYENPAFGVAKVTGPDRLYFLTDEKGCPNATAACRQRAYVVAGDAMITGRSRGAYTCAFFPNKVGGAAGWVASARLAPQAVAAMPSLTAWTGLWRDGDNEIQLTAKGQALSVAGEAYWPSANPSLKERPGGPNVGALEGTSTPRGNAVTFDDGEGEYSCRVTLRLVGPYLAAQDNNHCGGMNVSFTGVYIRAR